MIKKQADLVRDKLLLQFSRVSSKFKPEKSVELTNQEVTLEQIQVATYQYFTSGGSTDQYGLYAKEWFHERVCRLSKEQMRLFRMRFEEAMELDDIAKKIKISRRGVEHRLEAMFDVLRR